MARTDSENENDETRDEERDELHGEDEPSDDSAESDAHAAEGGESDEGEDGDVDARAARKGGEKGVRRFKDGTTAGARLAAAKAAKAARKAAKRGAEKKAEEQEPDPVAQVRENPIVQRAEKAGTWARANRNAVLGAVAAALVALGAFVGWSQYRDQQAAAAASLLEEALRIADADVVGEDAPEPVTRPGDPPPPPRYPTAQARAEAALEAHRQVLAQFPSSGAATWARLGEARALYDLGRHAEARSAYDQAIQQGAWEPTAMWRALEGKAFTFEAEEQWAQAREVYDELARIEDGRFEPVAKYHTARMFLAQGQREQATETLRRLVDQLRAAEEDAAAQDFPFVLAQAQVRLRELDPSAAPPSDPPGGGLGGLGEALGGPDGNLSQEQIQELIRRFQQQQGGAGE